MSAVTQRRYPEANVNAFRAVLSKWLAALPADGREGGVKELGKALWEITRLDRPPTHIPSGTGLGRVIAAEQGFLRAQGFVVQSRRTEHARALRFIRG